MSALIDPDASPRAAFGLADELSPGVQVWHAHHKHQLLYSAAGLLRLECERAQWLLPPQRLAWIAAHTRHRIVVPRSASLRTVYLAPEMLAATAPCVVLAASPLAREMVCYATRWGPLHEPSPASQHFFSALAALCTEWSAAPLPLSLPAAESPEVERAMRYALDHLDRDISLADAARAAGTSTRTLSRRFSAEAKQGWKAFVHQARMLRAMELLARPRASVSAVSAAVGFDSLSAFSRAFSAFAGESPKDYQGRALGGAAQHTSQKTKNTLQSRQPKDA